MYRNPISSHHTSTADSVSRYIQHLPCKNQGPGKSPKTRSSYPGSQLYCSNSGRHKGPPVLDFFWVGALMQGKDPMRDERLTGHRRSVTCLQAPGPWQVVPEEALKGMHA